MVQQLFASLLAQKSVLHKAEEDALLCSICPTDMVTSLVLLLLHQSTAINIQIFLAFIKKKKKKATDLHGKIEKSVWEDQHCSLVLIISLNLNFHIFKDLV